VLGVEGADAMPSANPPPGRRGQGAADRAVQSVPASVWARDGRAGRTARRRDDDRAGLGEAAPLHL